MIHAIKIKTVLTYFENMQELDPTDGLIDSGGELRAENLGSQRHQRVDVAEVGLLHNLLQKSVNI